MCRPGRNYLIPFADAAPPTVATSRPPAEIEPTEFDYKVAMREISALELANEEAENVSREVVAALAANIAQNGLLHPLVVTTAGRVIAGHHRLRACEMLAWRRVPVVILPDGDVRTALISLDENLMRRRLTVLERGEHLRQRKVIYDDLYPESARPGARRKKDADDQRNDFANPCFARDVAAHLSVSVRHIQQEVQIATKLSAEVKRLLTGTPLADSKVALLKLARLPHGEQLTTATELLAMEQSAEAPGHAPTAKRKKRGDGFGAKKVSEQALTKRLHDLVDLAVEIFELSPELTARTLEAALVGFEVRLIKAQAVFETLDSYCKQATRAGEPATTPGIRLHQRKLPEARDADEVF